MIAILLAPVYLLANYYLLRRVMGWVKAWFPFFRTARHWALPVTVQAFLACSVVIAFFLPEGELRRAMKLVGNYWLGVLLYVLLAVSAADLLRLLLGHVLPFRHIFITTKMHRAAGCVCALVILAASVWGVINTHIIHVTPYDVTVEKTVEGIDELKIVLVSDLHLGYNIGEKQMLQMVEKINGQDADLVVIAGDIFDNEWEAVDKPEAIAATLRGIQSKYGVYACYGNHDIEEPVLAGFTFRQSAHKESDPRMDEFLKDAGITLLHDEGTLIDGKFYLYGRADAHRPGRGIETRKTPGEITSDMDRDKPIIVLDHQPKELQELADAGVDLDLCGHTHDGQMFPGNLTIKLMWENACGYLRKGEMHNIVTSGVGVFGPDMRVGTKAEICPITVHFANG
jgi:predicted MPP superfamily phosphohydrolase